MICYVTITETVDVFISMILRFTKGNGLRYSFLGCALMEIVTAPDFHSADDARSFVRDLRNLLVELGVCDGKMAGNR